MSIDLLFNMEKSGTVNAVRTLVQYESQLPFPALFLSLFIISGGKVVLWMGKFT